MASKPKWDYAWAAEHGPAYDVPDLIKFMVDKKILADLSWHNDISPKFVYQDPRGNSEKYVAIWVDHPVGSERETGPGGKRFGIEVATPGSGGDYSLETDDLEEALRELCSSTRQLFPKAKYHPDFDGIVREWIKSTVQKY